MNGTKPPALTPPKETVTSSPIGDSLQRHIDDVLTQIPSGKRGAATVGVSTTGVVAEVGAKVVQRDNLNVTVGGWAGKVWGGSGWTAGAKAAVIW